MTLWTTPDTPASITWTCRSFTIPYVLLDKVLGAIAELLNEDNWTKDGTMSVEDAVEYLDDMWANMKRCNVIGQVIFGVWDVLPDDTLPCDGTLYQRVDYPALYSVIAPGLIIDADTFITPNLTARFPKSPGPAQQVGDVGGLRNVILTIPQMPTHRHSQSNYSTNIDLEGAGVPDPLSVGLPIIPTLSGARGGGEPHPNMPPYTVLNFAMVAK